jgi:hypothetical protein
MENPTYPVMDLSTKESSKRVEQGEKMSRDGLNEQPFMLNVSGWKYR